VSHLLAPGWLAGAHLFAAALAVLWNIAVAGRIARWRDAPRTLSALSALAGLLIAPAVFLAVIGSTALLGRSLHSIGWVWPATTVLVAAQAVLAAARGLVPALSVAPVIAHDLVVAAVACARLGIVRGAEVPAPLLDLVAAQTTALELSVHPEAALLPIYLYVPLLAPAVPARRLRLALVLRAALAMLAAVWTALTLVSLPLAREAARGYARWSGEQLQERPQGDLAVGLKLFPSLGGVGPPPLAIASDLELARRVDAQVLSVYIRAGRASGALLDSLARVLDEPRRGGRRLIAVLDFADDVPLRGAPPGEAHFAARVREVEAIVRRLRPDYLVPAMPRPGLRPRVRLPRWESYLARAAATAHLLRPRTRVLVPIGGYGARDSALYAWAVRRGSGVDGVGFRVVPSARGALGLDARLLAVERWMRAHPSRAQHWVLEAGGLPLAHGEPSQALAVWHTIAWATRHPAVSGVVVYQASDYESPTGLRATGGRIRPAASAVERAVRALGESAAGQ
jgi:hypothetical protein